MGKKNFKKKQTKSLDERKKELREASKLAAQESARQKQTVAPSQHSIDKLLDKAEELIDEFNYELAQKFCQRALEMEPDNARALETSASLLLELGNTESAKHCLSRAVEVHPESGFSKYMTLGQLMEGEAAVQCYQKGIELMIKEKQEKEAQEVAAACSSEGTVTSRDISSAYCAIAEIYLTDCCFEEGAEEKCKEFVDKAVSADPQHAEALQLKASFLLSKDDREQARELIKQSVSLWLPKLQAVDGDQPPEEEFDPVEPCSVPYGARVQCGKILIEVEEHETAIDVLETLLDEDDEVPDVWYLIGWASYLQGEEYYGNARHYLQKGIEVYKKVKHEDAALLAHMEELLTGLGPGESDDVETNGAAALEIDSSDEENMDQ